MLCEECGKREAVYHTTTNINGAIGETHLCVECQSLRGGADLFKGLGGLFNMFAGAADATEKAAKKRQVCPECGTAWDDFLKSGGYLGCEACYGEFAASLRPVVLKTQGKLRHTGKTPRAAPEDARAAQIRRLGEELNRALAAERYEECARLKKDLDRLKQ
jgi:protein arginine kinase activator